MQSPHEYVLLTNQQQHTKSYWYMCIIRSFSHIHCGYIMHVASGSCSKGTILLFKHEQRPLALACCALLQCRCCPLWLSCNRSPVSAHLSDLFEQMQASKACRLWQGKAQGERPRRCVQILFGSRVCCGGGCNSRPQCRCTHTHAKINQGRQRA
jgi:hypothetical protein